MENKEKYIYSVFINYLLSGKYFSKNKKNINEEFIKYIKEKCDVKKAVYNTTYLVKLLISLY